MLSQTMRYELPPRGEAVYFMVNIIILWTRYSFGKRRKYTPIIEKKSCGYSGGSGTEIIEVLLCSVKHPLVSKMVIYSIYEVLLECRRIDNLQRAVYLQIPIM